MACNKFFLVTFLILWMGVTSFPKVTEKERPGFCPFNDLPHEEGTTKSPKCFSDSDCWKNAKCCERGSSKDCLPILKEKPGQCPHVCEPKSNLKCSTDKDCPKDLKCCHQCAQTCMVPVKVMCAVPSQ